MFILVFFTVVDGVGVLQGFFFFFKLPHKNKICYFFIIEFLKVCSTPSLAVPTLLLFFHVPGICLK
jgi:hypothetical protein